MNHELRIMSESTKLAWRFARAMKFRRPWPAGAGPRIPVGGVRVLAPAAPPGRVRPVPVLRSPGHGCQPAGTRRFLDRRRARFQGELFPQRPRPVPDLHSIVFG